MRANGGLACVGVGTEHGRVVGMDGEETGEGRRETHLEPLLHLLDEHVAVRGEVVAGSGTPLPGCLTPGFPRPARRTTEAA